MQHRLQRRGMVDIEVASTACSADQAAANREEIRVARTILDDELWRGHPGHAEAASKFDDRVAQLRFAMIAIHGDRARFTAIGPFSSGPTAIRSPAYPVSRSPFHARNVYTSTRPETCA